MVRVSKSRPVKLRLYAPEAKKVNLAGSFNNWDTKTLSAKRDSRGNWAMKASLKPGRYEYKFFVDENWVVDPNSSNHIPNTFGTHNCVLEVK